MFGASALRQRTGRRALLDVEQLAERVAAEIAELGHVLEACGIVMSPPCSSTATNVTILFGGSSMNSCTWLCWSVAPSAASGVLADRLTVGPRACRGSPPTADEPRGHVAQRIRVRHEHVDRPAMLRVGSVLERANTPAGFLREIVGRSTVHHVAGTGEQLARRRCRSAPRERSNRREHAESPADVRRNVERRHADRRRERRAARRSRDR